MPTAPVTATCGSTRRLDPLISLLHLHMDCNSNAKTHPSTAIRLWRTLSSQIVRATIPSGPIGIRSMSMTARPRQSVHDTSFMAT
ncbi:hypothetical protein IGI04_042784 [Brassica rapa subsp. trilocularis]|uniref:Uncharacterized protein n=1 Tax=Brassica rapa subsp. trilocularis TaxID=1813537 RepID=A0ABQ7KHH8_BRACM|nr:hypothetical protein IGI04_042784 [Brassica rapa subsp. trilocularis]